MKISEDVWESYQKRLGYTDDEMNKFRPVLSKIT